MKDVQTQKPRDGNVLDVLPQQQGGQYSCSTGGQGREREGGLEAGGRIIQGLGEQGKDHGFYSSGSGAPVGSEEGMLLKDQSSC